jgi:oxygen-dependent protoporphyrinogen oxidase
MKFITPTSLLVLLIGFQAGAAFTPIQNSARLTARTALMSSDSPNAAVDQAPREVDCLVVGSGISGSCLAFQLTKNHGIDNLLLTERNPVVGGNVISMRNDDGFVWEEGPNSFQPTPAICQTIHELGLDNELVLADGSLPRFVYYKGNGAGEKLADLHALPTNLPGDLFDFFLLTWPGKIRAGLGALGFVSPPPQDREESVREFVTRHLGEETFERVIDPFVSGVYAGDPDALSMKAALKKIHRLEGLGDFGPGLVSGALNRFKEIAQEKKQNPPDPAWPTYKAGELGSFRNGLQTLPNRIAEVLGDKVLTSRALEKVEKASDGRFKATFSTPDGPETVIAKVVCLTSPTRVTCKVAADLIPAAGRLEEVYSPPVASVTMAYKKEWFKQLPGGTTENPLRGFGHLLPRTMGVRSLGTIWSSSLFPGRAPKGWELLLTYIGGARDPSIKDMSIDDIYKQVDADNKKILLKPDAPEGKRIACRVWSTAIPQYRKGHLEILEAVEKDEAKCPGFFLGGNYRTGVAFGDCVAFGMSEAKRVSDFLATSDDIIGAPEPAEAASAKAPAMA